MLNNSSAIEPITGVQPGTSPRLDSYPSKPDLPKVRGSAGRYGLEEHDEMRKNLDPLIFADKEFANELLEEQELNASSTSFIEFTTQIGNENKIVKQQSSTPHNEASGRKMNTLGRSAEFTSPTSAHDANSYARGGVTSFTGAPSMSTRNP